MFREVRLKKKKGLSLIEMLLVLGYVTAINGFLITMVFLTLKIWTVTKVYDGAKNHEINLTMYIKREIENQKNIDLVVKEGLIEIKRTDKKIIFSYINHNLKVKYIDQWGRKLKENIILKNIEKIKFIEKGELLYMKLLKDGVEKNWVFQRKKWVDF